MEIQSIYWKEIFYVPQPGEVVLVHHGQAFKLYVDVRDKQGEYSIPIGWDTSGFDRAAIERRIDRGYDVDNDSKEGLTGDFAYALKLMEKSHRVRRRVWHGNTYIVKEAWDKGYKVGYVFAGQNVSAELHPCQDTDVFETDWEACTLMD